MSKRKYYAGIGSRQTPPDICKDMIAIAKRLSRAGWTLRSGFAEGADEAFEIGHGKGLKEIFLPYRGFRDHPSLLTNSIPKEIMLEAYDLASKIHPAWEKCNSAARKLHTRNMFQVLGSDLQTPVECVICWTRDGGPTGGTGQAIRLATEMDIPVWNLFHEGHRELALRLT